MSHNILLTGASGYLGGSLLTKIHQHGLPAYGTLYASIRSEEQAKAVESYGATPINIDMKDENAITTTIVEKRITIVLFLIDPMSPKTQIPMIKALGQVKDIVKHDVHFLHASGAKMFSSLAGYPTDKPVLDSDPGLYDIHVATKPPFEAIANAVNTDLTVIDTSEAAGVRSYIFVPCIVYGKGFGFGNKISIQTVAVIRAAKALRKVCDVNPEPMSWPVCQVQDTTALFKVLLDKILEGENVDYGRNGFYLAASGSISWGDIYAALAKGLAKRGVIDDEAVVKADDAALEEMATALDCPKDFVQVQLGGRCAFTAEHAKSLGWKPKYKPEHILEAADEEVEVVLQYLK